MLTTAVSPSAAAGAISPASGFVDAGTIPVSATANPGYVFTGFTGGLSGTTTPQNLMVNAPVTVTANFSNKQPITVSPMSLGFGSQGLNGPTAAQTVTVRNNRIVPINFSFSLTGATPPDFQPVPMPTTFGTTLAAGANCTIS